MATLATLTQRPPLLEEVVTDRLQTVEATVTVPAVVADGDEHFIGKVVRSLDGGLTYEKLTETVWAGVSAAVDDLVFHNGHIWKSLAATNVTEPGTDVLKWEDQGIWDANGILIQNIDVTRKAVVLVTGSVKKSYLRSFEASMQLALFQNKIILK